LSPPFQVSWQKNAIVLGREAINIAGWVGVLLPPIWMLALIAAFVGPQTGEGAQIAISQAETKRTRYCNCQYLPTPHHSSEQYSCFNFRCSGLWFHYLPAFTIMV
jgi:hypothetical protein